MSPFIGLRWTLQAALFIHGNVALRGLPYSAEIVDFQKHCDHICSASLLREYEYHVAAAFDLNQ